MPTVNSLFRALSAVVLLAAVALVGALALSLGMVRFSGPSLPQFSTVDIELTLPDEARIVEVEPIHLDCRARVYAEVPVEGLREHRAFGRVYRTDRISMRAYGDLDTCVDGTGTTVTHHADGTTDVVIDASSIVFVRPRVDAVRTAGTVEIDRDVVGKVVDAFPWVDDDLGLTPAAYAFAQNVIGSSRCTEAAYDVTRGLLVEGYRQQAIDQGVAPERLTVTIEGEPDFTDPEPIELDGTESGRVELWSGSTGVTCQPGPGGGRDGL